MGNSRVEITVGLFLVMGFLALGWLALQLGEVPWLTGAKTYTLNAEFNNISGVKAGADIQISGVTVGKVRQLHLSEDNLAIVTMQLDKGVTVPVDSMASVKSQGIIGDKFIQITLGGDETAYQPGETIVDTESSVDLESLISKFAFGQVDK
jgi:phospholipid/cholesterol/gamma-HCH transport system substrate-binding protein